MAVPSSTFPCPKCGRKLRISGELTVGDVTIPTFQCDECIYEADFLGEKMELPLTFAVDDQGRAFDPADPERDLSR